MPATIYARPDIGPPLTETTPVPAVSAWTDAAWAEIHAAGSWAKLPNLPTSEKHEQRNQSAWMTYGIRPTNILLPQADPLDIRLRLKRFNSTAVDRRANVRLLVRDIAAADPHRTGVRATRARERLSWHARLRPADVTEAHQVVSHFDNLTEGISKRVPEHRMTTNAHGILAFGTILAILAAALAPEGPQFRAWQVTLAALVAVACAFHIGRERGWKYGYDQAIWHSAEVCGAETLDARRRDEEAAARAEQAAAHAQLEAAAAAESAAGLGEALRARRMAFKLPRPPRNEGYLYVIAFSTGTVKVGQTEDPKVRLATHRNEAAAFGVHVTDYWISPSHSGFRDNETRLINRCAEVSHRSRKEYFHAVTYTTAVGFANELTYRSKNTEQTSVQGVWA